MSCAINDLVVRFPSVGVEIVPYGADYRAREHQLEYSKLEVSRAAGDLIVSRIEDDPIPAVLSVNGEDICRLAADEDSVEHVGDISWVSLKDPRTVLENGHIEWEPEEASFGEAARYIFERRKDPYNVLTGVKVMASAEDAEKDQPELTRAERWADRTAPEFLRNLTVNGEPVLYAERMRGQVRFRGESPFEAISEIQDIFSVRSWVTTDGVLTFGYPGDRATIGVVGEERGDLRLANHNIVEQAIPFSAVGGRGTYVDFWRSELGPIKYNSTTQGQFQVNSVATFSGSARTRRKYLGTRPVKGVDELEQIVKNELLDSISQSASGSLTINAAVSAESAVSPQELEIGDILAVPGIDRDCHKNVREGAYFITGLNHRISPREGWMVTANVSRYFSNDEISVFTEVKGPGSDEWVEADTFAEDMFNE